MALLGLDIGTTGCKAVVYSGAGEILGSAYREYTAVTEGKLAELDPNAVWEQVQAVLAEAVERAGVPVEAIGVSSFGESAVPIDRDGSALANAILYTDPRGEEECAALREFSPITKLSAHPMYTVSKIMWQKKHKPELFARVWKYLLFEDYIIYKLTGNCFISYSEATRTGCFDVEKRRFSPEVLDRAGISAELFSEPVPSGTPCGRVRGFLPLDGALVTTGGQDQLCSALGAGAVTLGSAVCGLGTVECIAAVFQQPIDDLAVVNKGYCCVPYALPDTYVTYAYSYTGGALVKWFRDKLADTGAKNVYRDYDQRVENLKTPLLVLPHFAGAATPYMDVDAAGAILGLSLSSTREEIFRAILEGCCFEMLLNLEELKQAGITVDSVTATGGGASSTLWLQIHADVFGIPVRSLKNSEAGTAGAAMLAGTAAGIFPDLQTAAKALVQFDREYLPDPGRHEEYLVKFEKYRKLYKALKELR